MSSDIKRKSLTVGESLTDKQVFLVADAEIESKGLIRHHIESMDNFYKTGIRQIVTRIFKVEKYMENKLDNSPEDRSIRTIQFTVNYTGVTLSPPTTKCYQGGGDILIYPQMAISHDKHYRGVLAIDAEITATAHLRNGGKIVRKGNIQNLRIGKIPIMVGSCYCNTKNLSKKTLEDLKEDPNNKGGYFIINGAEWVVDMIENILFNEVRIFKNAGFGKEVIRAEIVSKPGDSYQNQDYLIVRWMSDGQITCEIARGVLKKCQIPFYVMFRLLGWAMDKTIYENIVIDNDAPYAKNMYNFIKDAFDVNYPIVKGRKQISNLDAIGIVIDELKKEQLANLELDKFPENYPQAVKIIHRHIDENLLPRIGLTSDTRHLKARFIADIIRKIFLVKLDVIKPTDRDSYRSKRVHAAGESLAKPFKTYFNEIINQKIKQRFVREFKRQSFSQVQLEQVVKSSIVSTEFSRLLLQSITIGTKALLTVSVSRKVTNRLSSQLLNRKNPLNVLSVLRQVTTTSDNKVKQTERAQEMRRVHMSFLGYICIVHSPDGEPVGLRKQLALCASLCSASPSEILRRKILDDPDARPYADVPAQVIGAEKLSKVNVNGEPICLVKSAAQFADKYRILRRAGKIDEMTTIHWETTQDEVLFWTDVGRITRPLMIVYNNRRNKVDAYGNPIDYSKLMPRDVKKKEGSVDEEPFCQGIALTEEIVNKLYNSKITITDLMKMGIIEYITPDEQENCYVCPSHEDLMDHKNDEDNEYTHCDIPKAIIGLTGHVAALGHHNQTTRCLYLTIQAKQTCGRFAENWPYRCDKEAFLQYTVEKPLLTTLTNHYSSANGLNAIVLYNCAEYNVEDSIIMGKGCKERGLANGSKFTFYRSELEQKEEFKSPDLSTTTFLHAANYSKLDSRGIVKVGEHIVTQDVLISKIAKNSRSGDEKYAYVDTSTIYTELEPAIVSDVIIDRNEEDTEFRKVVLRKPRPVVIGDKFSSRSGQKGICALMPRDSELPRTPDGMAPEIIVNPHGIPSRMTMAQLIETHAGNLCAMRGIHMDGSMFSKIDIKVVGEELEKLGMNKYGYHQMYHGETGRMIGIPLFMGPTYYQRLLKFVVDQVYSIEHGPTDAITYQPTRGKARHGGIRIGEMEVWGLVAHGVPNFLREKFGDHSDAYNWDMCRCGKPPITNRKTGLIKCKECRDTADIVEIPTTWSSKLFLQELESMNVGVRVIPTPLLEELHD